MNPFSELVTAIMTPLQDVENALQQLFTERTIDNATGINLDVIGKLVGQVRNGATDDDYRRTIRARVASNRSAGTMPDMIRVAKLLIGGLVHVEGENYGNATQRISVQDVEVSDALGALLLGFMTDTESAGVRTIVQYGNAPPSSWMKFDTVGRGWDANKWIGSVD